MSETTAVPIGDEEFTGTDTFAVHSPYNGAELGRVPSVRAGGGAPCGRCRSCRVGAATVAPGRDPRRRGTAIERSGRRVRADHRGRGGEADPHRACRGRASSGHIRLLGRRGSQARRRDGAPRCERAGRRQARFHPSHPHRSRRRHQPLQLPAQPRRPQGGARDRRWLSGRAQARQPNAVLGHHLGANVAPRVRSPARPPQRGDRRGVNGGERTR